MMILMEEKTQAIILQAIPYLGKSRILKAFSREFGMLSFICKKSSLASLSPFCLADCTYNKRASELYTLSDGSSLDSLIELRQSYKTLMTAGTIAQDLLQSQLPGKAAPALYDLLYCYFKKLPDFANPSILSSSFRLKLLLHEGLLSLKKTCSQCDSKASALQDGESVCTTHASLPSFIYQEDDWQVIHLLAFARQFAPLQQIQPSSSLEGKIQALFARSIER